MSQRDAFVAALRDLFTEVRATGAAEVAVFPAMPAALALEFGRVAALGANPTLAVWDRTGSGWAGPWRV